MQRSHAVTTHHSHDPAASAVEVIDVAGVLSRPVLLSTGASLPSAAPAQGGTTP
jgi:hypothetical protein